jgi:hypothetical protein
MEVDGPETIGPHPPGSPLRLRNGVVLEGRNEMEGGRKRLSWLARGMTVPRGPHSTSRVGRGPAGEESCGWPLRENDRGEAGFRSDVPHRAAEGLASGECGRKEAGPQGLSTTAGSLAHDHGAAAVMLNRHCGRCSTARDDRPWHAYGHGWGWVRRGGWEAAACRIVNGDTAGLPFRVMPGLKWTDRGRPESLPANNRCLEHQAASRSCDAAG